MKFKITLPDFIWTPFGDSLQKVSKVSPGTKIKVERIHQKTLLGMELFNVNSWASIVNSPIRKRKKNPRRKAKKFEFTKEGVVATFTR